MVETELKKIQFQNNMDALNAFMKANNSKINHPMRRRLREYFHQSRHVQSTMTNTDLLKMLSPALQGEVTWATWQSPLPLLQAAAGRSAAPELGGLSGQGVSE